MVSVLWLPHWEFQMWCSDPAEPASAHICFGADRKRGPSHPQSLGRRFRHSTFAEAGLWLRWATSLAICPYLSICLSLPAWSLWKLQL